MSLSFIYEPWVTPELLRMWLEGAVKRYREAQEEIARLQDEVESTKKELERCKRRYEILRGWHELKMEPADDEEP